MTEKGPPDDSHKQTLKEIAESTGAQSVQPSSEIHDPLEDEGKKSPTDSEKEVAQKVNIENHVPVVFLCSVLVSGCTNRLSVHPG